jgi:3-hydroxyisobutyrate dehydrogenase
MSESRPRVAFIGTGVMGAAMAGHLQAAGYPLTVFTRTPTRAQALLDAGAAWADSPAAAVAGADFLISIVGYPDDVRQVYLGREGAVAAARPGAVLIDMTTSAPSLAREIAAAAAERGSAALDAPVSGGDVGARNATLSIMVGGDPAAFERARPLLEVMGKTVVHQGPPGSGQHTKLVNQITIASTMIGVMEGLAYARAAGLDPDTVLASIGAGAASSWSLANLLPRVLRGDLAPGFFIRHFVKDLRIALDEADEMGLDLPGLELAHQLYERVMSNGGGDYGTQALWLAYEAGAGR